MNQKYRKRNKIKRSKEFVKELNSYETLFWSLSQFILARSNLYRLCPYFYMTRSVGWLHSLCQNILKGREFYFPATIGALVG